MIRDAHPDPEPPTSLITGGAGFIGSHLTDFLVERGERVRVLDNLTTGRLEHVAHLRENPRFEFTEGDVRDADILDSLATGCSRMYHLAAVVGVQNVLEDPLEVMDVNILGSRKVLEVARRTDAAVFLASTSEIYGKNLDVPYTEDSDRLLGPPQIHRWSYSSSKAVEEVFGLAHAAQYDMQVVIGRFFNVVGQRQTGKYGMVVPQFVQQALSGEPLTVYGDGEQTRTFCDVRDAVRAIVGLMDDRSAAGHPYNIGSRREISIRDLARLILKHLAPDRAKDPASIRHIPYDEAYPDGFEEFPRRTPDISRVEAQIGWNPTRSFIATLDWITEEVGREAREAT